MFRPYDRNHISEVLLLHGEKISPVFCVGRKKNPTEEKVYFTIAFFLHCNDEQLKLLNSMVKKDDEELLVNFSATDKDGKVYPLFFDSSYDEKFNVKSFDFTRSWTAHRCDNGFDELREVNQNIISITFD